MGVEKFCPNSKFPDKSAGLLTRLDCIDNGWGWEWEWEWGDLTVSDGKSGHNHVGIADCLDLVDVVAGQDLVEECVQVVEKLDHFDSGAEAADRREADDVAEENGDGVEGLGRHFVPGLQGFGHSSK